MFAVSAPGCSVVKLDLWLNSLYIVISLSLILIFALIECLINQLFLSLSGYLTRLLLSLSNFYAPNN